MFNARYGHTDNTPIFRLNINTGGRILCFTLRRYDYLLESLQSFIHENKLNINLVKPLMLQIVSAMNKVYYIVNRNISYKEVEFLRVVYYRSLFLSRMNNLIVKNNNMKMIHDININPLKKAVIKKIRNIYSQKAKNYERNSNSF